MEVYISLCKLVELGLIKKNLLLIKQHIEKDKVIVDEFKIKGGEIMENLSVVEKRLYDYIKEKGEVTFDDIKKDLGDKYLGASGRLIQKDLVETTKKLMGKQKVGYERYGSKWVKILRFKEVN